MFVCGCVIALVCYWVIVIVFVCLCLSLCNCVIVSLCYCVIMLLCYCVIVIDIALNIVVGSGSVVVRFIVCVSAIVRVSVIGVCNGVDIDLGFIVVLHC